MSYTGQTPDTEPATDWRKTAACRDEEPELFFPKGHEGPWLLVIKEAKAVCRRCPSKGSCLAYALDHRVSDGIFGGLTDKERASIQRRKARGHDTRPPARTAEQRPDSLREAFERRARTAADGHVVWDGSTQFKWRTRKYNPLRVAFALHHGREPEGTVRRGCGHRACYAGGHLSDAVIRASAGERATLKAIAS